MTQLVEGCRSDPSLVTPDLLTVSVIAAQILSCIHLQWISAETAWKPKCEWLTPLQLYGDPMILGVAGVALVCIALTVSTKNQQQILLNGILISLMKSTCVQLSVKVNIVGRYLSWSIQHLFNIKGVKGLNVYSSKYIILLYFFLFSLMSSILFLISQWHDIKKKVVILHPLGKKI